jgi:O-antigen/teichoic acid export membrane protein
VTGATPAAPRGGLVTRLIRTVLAMMPPGTVAVGSGLVILGAASYVHLAVAGYSLDDSGYSKLSVAWTIVFSIGFGLFQPIEQELARLVAARRVAGEGYAPVFWRGLILSSSILAAVGVVLVVLGGPISHSLFDGDRHMLWVLFGGFAGIAMAHPTKGMLSGTGRFGSYGAQLGIDGGLRIALAAVFGAIGVHSALAYTLILTIAPLAAVLATLGGVRQAMVPGPQVAWPALTKSIGPLVVSTLLAQLVVNVGVINVKLLDPHDAVLAGAVLSALVLARIPVFVFASLQAALLPRLSTLIASGQLAHFRHQVIRACMLVLIPCAAFGIPAIFLGPWAITVFFDAKRVLGDWDFALLVTGTTAYILALVLGQAVMALGRHRLQTLAWLVGSATLAAVTLVPGDISLRVGAGYLVGSATVAGVLLAMLWRIRPRNRSGGEPQPAVETPLVPVGELP